MADEILGHQISFLNYYGDPFRHRLVDCRVYRFLGCGSHHQAVDTPDQQILDVRDLLLRLSLASVRAISSISGYSDAAHMANWLMKTPAEFVSEASA